MNKAQRFVLCSWRHTHTHTHLKWCENTKLVSVGMSSAALPRMKIWVENTVYHPFDHNIWEHVCA